MADRHNMTEALFASSDLHQKVLNDCIGKLMIDGCFRKEEVMADVHDSFLIDSVRWDWIVKKLIDDKSWPGGSINLIPVAESFFKAKAAEKRAMQITDDPLLVGTYMAHGYGKRTAGWVMGTFAEGRFALWKADMAQKNIAGRKKQNGEFGKAITKQLIHGGKTEKVVEIAKVTGIPVPRKIAKV
jgi:hypothetical protein